MPACILAKTIDFLLQPSVDCFWDWKRALVQNRTENAHISSLKFLHGFPSGFAAGRVCFQHQHDTIAETTQDDGVVAGTQGCGIDENVIECTVQLGQPYEARTLCFAFYLPLRATLQNLQSLSK